ncbi:hypothetical protein TWF706_004607 [Orbilia oligospora]|nr:hypothetical protein TWF706_004607 [Orbilia oligospora]
MASIPYRYLTLWHEERLLNDTMPDLKPGEAAFRSYYLPSLEGGLHTIKIEQTVTAPTGDPKKPLEKKAVPITQDFTVVAPRFSLAEETIDSMFPPRGHTALPKTLPHLVLKDAHFPWARNYSTPAKQDEDQCPVDSSGDCMAKTRIPWVALVAFTPDELAIEDPAILGKFAGDPKFKVNENLAIDATIGPAYENLKLGTNLTTSLIGQPDSREKGQTASFISIKKKLFEKLFSEDGKKGSITQYRYLSHVRKISTAGMISAMHGTDGTFSVIVSHRIGPFDTTRPTPLIAHLISLEGIEGKDISTWKDNIIMTSLYSWTYTSLPPGSFDVRDVLQKLGDTLTVLRTDFMQQPVSNPKTKALPLEDIITKRQEDGYTLVRHRTVTGEETAAIYRGPLVPKSVSHGQNTDMQYMTIQSNFGTDLQILDPDLSLMDISYAAAWQLGKTLAMGDQAFTAALSRVRRHMHMEALKASQKKVHEQLGDHMSRLDVVKSIPALVKGLSDLNLNLHANNTNIISSSRWQKQCVERVDISLKSPHIFYQIYENAVPVALDMASSPAGGKYNYHKVPTNTDYAQVQSWVHDKLHLASIPAHYLIPDRSYLPEETLRFFYIDENWTDALVDGALSLANQWTNEPDKDYCRSALKAALGDFFRQKSPEFGYQPQMPKYGFLLRSQVLVQFPDLTVSATFNEATAFNDEKPKAPILVQRKLSSDIMLCLFDCTPPKLKSLKFTLPAHQQMYTAAAKFSQDTMTLDIKKMYTVEPGKAKKPRDGQVLRSNEYTRSDSKIFDWESRTMKTVPYVKEVHKILTAADGMGADFTEPKSTSAMLALQLNEPIYTLDIGEIIVEPFKAFADEPFQFLVPPFPAHRYKPPPLPLPPKKPRLYPTKLSRPVGYPPRAMPRAVSTSDPIQTFDRPIFKFQVYTLDAPSTPNVIPTGRKPSPDLVFSIRTSEEWRESSNWTLLKLTLKIRRGDGDPEDGPWPLLIKDYEPEPPTMLSNLRFNIFTRYSNEFLIIDLVPRSSKGVVLKYVREASFLLSMVKTREWMERKQMYIYLLPTYKENEDKDKDPDFEPWDDGIVIDMVPDALPSMAEDNEWDFVDDSDDLFD